MGSRVRIPVFVKIISSLLIIVLGLSAFSILFYAKSTHYQEQYRLILQSLTTANGTNGQITQTMKEMDEAYYGSTASPEAAFKENLKKVKEALPEITRHSDSKTRSDVARYFGQIEAAASDFHKSLLAGSREEALAKLGDMKKSASYYQEQMQKITQDELKRSERVSQDIEDSASRSKLLFMAALAGTFLFSGWIAFYLSRNIAGTVRRITRVANDLAARNFTETQIKVTSRDELGEVAAAFTEMTGNITDVIRKVYSVGDQMQNVSVRLLEAAEYNSSAGEAISGSVEEMVKAIEDENAELRDTSETIGDMGVLSSAIDQRSATIKERASESTQLADEGLAYLHDFTSQLQQLNAAFFETGRMNEQLKQKTDNMNQMLQSITDISKKTNILALNASIETARAGSAGNSFAVIANEIRGLANMVSASTYHIQSVVESLQQDAGSLNQVMRESIRQLEQGNVQAAAAHDNFRVIADSSREVFEAIRINSGEIAQLLIKIRKLQRNKARIDTLTAANASSISSIASATQEQAAHLQQVSAIAHSLSVIAADLDQEMKTFKIS